MLQKCQTFRKLTDKLFASGMAAIPDQRESSPGGELLNALSPSRILPNHVIAVRRWRRLNEKNINNKIRRNIRNKRAVVVESRDLNFKRSKKIPLDVLTKDWLEHIGNEQIGT